MFPLILYPINLYKYVSIKNLAFDFLGRLCCYKKHSFLNSSAVHNFNPLEGRINLNFNFCWHTRRSRGVESCYFSLGWVCFCCCGSDTDLQPQRIWAGLLPVVYLNYERGQLIALKQGWSC